MRTLQPLIEMFDDMDPEDFVKSVKNVQDRAMEIPLTERFNKKLDVLMDKKRKENEDKIYISELLELSHEATSEDETAHALKNDEAIGKRAKASGMPMTKKEYEKRKAEREKARTAK